MRVNSALLVSALVFLLVALFASSEASRYRKRKFDGDFEFADEEEGKSNRKEGKKTWILDPGSDLCQALKCKKKELCLLEDEFTAVCVSKKELHKNGDVIIPKSKLKESTSTKLDEAQTADSKEYDEDEDDDSDYYDDDDNSDEDLLPNTATSSSSSNNKLEKSSTSSANGLPASSSDLLNSPNLNSFKSCSPCPVVKPTFLCGNDNRTYSSLCRLDYHNCIQNSQVTVSCKGFCPCKETPPIQPVQRACFLIQLQQNCTECVRNGCWFGVPKPGGESSCVYNKEQFQMHLQRTVLPRSAQECKNWVEEMKPKYADFSLGTIVGLDEVQRKHTAEADRLSRFMQKYKKTVANLKIQQQQQNLLKKSFRSPKKEAANNLDSLNALNDVGINSNDFASGTPLSANSVSGQSFKDRYVKYKDYSGMMSKKISLDKQRNYNDVLKPSSGRDCSEDALESMGDRLLDWFSVVMADNQKRKIYRKNRSNQVHFPGDCKREVQWMFSHLNSDEDGQLSLQELYDLENDRGEKCIKPFIDRCDTDKDIFISPLEWCNCFTKLERRCAPGSSRTRGKCTPLSDRDVNDVDDEDSEIEGSSDGPLEI